MNMGARLHTVNERFVDIADWISEAMGTPLNIMVWVLLVLIWFLIFAINPGLQHKSFMPSWFTSTAFNFPLNTVTTLAELYIGFLVAAATNRSERRSRELQHQQKELLETALQREERIEEQDQLIKDLVAQITAMEVQELIPIQHTQLATLREIHTLSQEMHHALVQQQRPPKKNKEIRLNK